MLKNEIKKIKKYYDEGYNIIELLKKRKNIMKNTDEMVKISYDFQSGSYIQSVKENPKFNKKYTEAIAKVINSNFALVKVLLHLEISILFSKKIA
jgi:hypothetical protein